MPAGRTLGVSVVCVVAAGIVPIFLPAYPLLSAGLTVVAGLVPAFVDYANDVGAQRANSPGPGRTPPFVPGAARARAASLVMMLTVVVAVGGGLAYAVSYGVGWLTGNETVDVQRLSKPATGRAGPLTVTVESVGITDHYTKVEVVARNRSEVPVRMQLFGSGQLVDEAGTVLQPKMGFGSDAGVDVPANDVPVRKVLTFDGLPAGKPTTLTLVFNTLFWQGFGPRSLHVGGIKLGAAA